MKNEINASALVMLAENNWGEFLEYCGSEDSADETLKALRELAGMEPVKE